MSDAVLVAMIGVAGTLVGALATVLAARIQAAHKAAQVPPSGKAETSPVLGESVDIRELRILRALFGEPKGRALESYKNGYYRPSLEAVVNKGWARRIEQRYYMTPKGADFCRAYLKELLGAWQPAAQVLA
jgi:hypothetical protein